MPAPDEITAAHDDVVATRARMAETIAQIEGRVTGQMDTVKAKLDVVQMIRDNPWTALALATGLGAAISATGTDAKVASAAAEKTREAAALAAEKAKQAGSAAAEALKGAPAAAKATASSAKGGVMAHLDELAAIAVEGFIDRLKRG